MIDEPLLRLALDELVPPSDEIAEWDDVLARSAAPGRRTWAPTRRILVAAACAAVALGAFAIAGPWRAGSSIVDRAAAAITPPSAHEILYESIGIRIRPPRRVPPGFRSRFPILWTGSAHVWLDGAAPRRFRVTMSGRFLYPKPMSARPGELGGTLDGFNGLVYDAASRTLLAVAFDFRVTQRVLDPAAFIRTALTTHHARVLGSTTIGGREAIRILLRARIFDRFEDLATYYIDAKTYRPIRVVINSLDFDPTPSGPSLPGMPLTSLTTLQRATLPSFGGQYVFDFREYRYLPPTDTSRAQSDIRAVHPHAKIQ